MKTSYPDVYGMKVKNNKVTFSAAVRVCMLVGIIQPDSGEHETAVWHERRRTVAGFSIKTGLLDVAH